MILMVHLYSYNPRLQPFTELICIYSPWPLITKTLRYFCWDICYICMLSRRKQPRWLNLTFLVCIFFNLKIISRLSLIIFWDIFVWSQDWQCLLFLYPVLGHVSMKTKAFLSCSISHSVFLCIYFNNHLQWFNMSYRYICLSNSMLCFVLFATPFSSMGF